MDAYRAEGNKTYSNSTLKMYLSYAPCGAPLGIPEERAKDCARQLRAFAGAHNFELNIKAARPYYRNEEELCNLMTSENCTVEGFRGDDYKDLAKYLGVTDYSGRTQDMRDRDRETKLKLKEIKYGEYDCTDM